MNSRFSHQGHCQYLYKHLLNYRKRPLLANPRMFMMNLDETRGCDDQHDLSGLRQAYRTHMGAEVYDRAMNLKSTPKDDLHVQQAWVHNHRETQTQLEQGLTWRNWLAYRWHCLFD